MLDKMEIGIILKSGMKTASRKLKMGRKEVI